MAKSNPLVNLIDRKLDVTHFREQHWEGTLWEYLDVVTENPAVARNAFSSARPASRRSCLSWPARPVVPVIRCEAATTWLLPTRVELR